MFLSSKLCPLILTNYRWLPENKGLLFWLAHMHNIQWEPFLQDWLWIRSLIKHIISHQLVFHIAWYNTTWGWPHNFTFLHHSSSLSILFVHLTYPSHLLLCYGSFHASHWRSFDFLFVVLYLLLIINLKDLHITKLMFQNYTSKVDQIQMLSNSCIFKLCIY